ncbi:MAG: PAS domain S-box protein [Bacteroidota bacterium]
MTNTDINPGLKILRQKAEKLLENNSSDSDLLLSKDETLKLVHELETYKIELEMQNDELLEAKEHAEFTAEKYTALYDFAPTGYFTLSQDGRIMDLNLCAASMLGIDRSNLTNNLLGFFISDDTKTSFALFLGKVFNSKKSETCEARLLTQGDQVIFVHLTGIATDNRDQCLVTMVDVSEKKEAEESIKTNTEVLEKNYTRLAKEILERRRTELALRESERNFHDVVQNFPGLVFQLRIWPDGSNSFSYISPKAVDYFGISSFSEVHELDLNSRIYPDDRLLFLSSLEKSITEKSDWYVETRIVNPKNEIKWLQVMSNPAETSDGLVFNGIMIDITERKLGEEALKMSLSKYQLLFETIPYGVTVCDENGKIIEANKEAERLLGISKEEQSERWIDSNDWKIIRTDGSPMPSEEFASVRAIKNNRLVSNVEMGIVKENNAVTWINVSASPIPLKGNGVVITYNEIFK